MIDKENIPGYNSIMFNVKPEPKDGVIPPASDRPMAFSNGSVNVKAEPQDVQKPLALEPADDQTANEEEDVKMALQVEEKPTLPFVVYNDASEIDYSPEEALKYGLEMVKVIRKALGTIEIGSKVRQDVWDAELANLEAQATPRTLIAVCGATGAGKSSILNAVLEDNVVPTNGMRACTAVVTEISYHDNANIEADVSFLSEEEWRQELGVLLQDLLDEDSGQIKRVNDLKSDAGVAWSKVNAVYPKIAQEQLAHMTVDQIIAHDATMYRVLGSKKTVSAKDSKTFAKEIGKYIDSKDKRSKKDKPKEKKKEPTVMDKVRAQAAKLVPQRDTRPVKGPDDSDPDGPAFWPLIRQVNVRCRSKALSTGAVLVDLPGVADANAARNSIAQNYMKKCNCIWILAPITRAVDDKTARDLLGEAFKTQLMMDGNYDDHTITFIASKSDDISCSEVAGNLELNDHPEYEALEDNLLSLKRGLSGAKKQKKEAEALAKSIEAGLKDIREQMKESQNHLEALKNGDTFVPEKKAKTTSKKRKNKRGGKKGSPKRRIVDSDDDDDFIVSDSDSESINSDSNSGSGDECSDDSNPSEDEMDDDDGDDDEISDITEEVLEAKIKGFKEAIKAQREVLTDARQAKKDQIENVAICEKKINKAQKAKNAFCALKRNESSKKDLKVDFRQGLRDLDEAAAEERDPENFDPSVSLRDYAAIDLPVFTCSSRDYVRLTGQVKGDGKASCFSNLEDTGIPGLQEWCHQLTVASRERAARGYRLHVKTFATTVQSYIQGIGDVTAADRQSLRDKWESVGSVGDENEDENQRYNWDSDSSSDDDEPEDHLQALLGSLGPGVGAGLYSMVNHRPAPKVDQQGKLVGVTPRLCSEFAGIIDECVNEIEEKFSCDLDEKCRLGAVNASASALTTLDEFSGSMHWGTYRATLRRHGCWRRDLNVELITPFTRNIAHTWGKIFKADLFGEFKDSTIENITQLAKEVEESAAPGLKDRTRKQGEICVEEARVALDRVVQMVGETLTTQQKEISRSLAPHVQAQMVQGYDEAMLEVGRGSVARQRASMRSYVGRHKDDIFDTGADAILARLSEAAKAIGATLDKAMGQLAQKVELSLAVLWEGLRDDPAQLGARATTTELMKTIQQQIELWTAASRTFNSKSVAV